MPPANQNTRFRLLDAITELESGERIVATKRLRPEEDYLKDHFPKFPVMPGVLMLEAMFQASAWLVRYSDDFARPIVLLKQAKSVKYADFVSPNQVLTVTAQIVKHDEHTVTVKAQGTVDGSVAVSGRLVLEQFRLADRYPNHSSVDPYARRQLKSEFARLWQPAALEVAG